MSSTRERADRDAGRERQLLGDADQRGRPAHRSVVDVGIGDGVDAGELQRAEEAADQQHADHPAQRRRRREQRAQAREEGGADDARCTISTVRKPKRRRMIGAADLHAHRAERAWRR